MSLSDSLTELELELLEATIYAPIAGHGNIAQFFKHFSLDAGLLPGGHERAMAIFEFQRILVDLLDFDLENLLDVLGEERIAEGYQASGLQYMLVVI